MTAPGSELPDSLAAFLRIFEFEKRSELEKYCRDLVVSRHDLAQVISACELRVLPLRHLIHHQDYVPAELRPSGDDLAALAENGVGPLKGRALKAVKKITETFKVRRYLVGHLFLPSNRAHWHFLYLDQRDIAEDDNHWKEGPHFHFLNWLWPRHSAESIWTAFRSGEAPGGALHVRFRDDRVPSGDA